LSSREAVEGSGIAGSGGDAPFAAVGGRIAEARRKAGLTRAALARAIGAKLWTIEQLEQGGEDPTRLLPRIAQAVGLSRSWFGPVTVPAGSAQGAQGEPVAARAPTIAERSGRNAVLASIVLLVLIRFFTEVTQVLPGAGNFVDIPLLMVLTAMVAVRPLQTLGVGRASLLGLGLAFLAIVAAASVVNPSRVEPAPALVFVYGFLAPLAYYYCAYRLWPPGQALFLSRCIVGLGLMEFLVVALVDLPRFIRSGNPDQISGTFGNNAYQLVFFLIVFGSLVAGVATFEKQRLTARLAPLLLGTTFVVVFLAQYRALLVATATSALAAGALLAVSRGRGVVVAAVVLGAFVLGLSYVAERFPTTKFAPTVAAIREKPGVFVSARLRPFEDVLRLYTDHPQFIVTGTGPGTYSSRAWRTFADVGDPANAEGAEQPFASAITGGKAYHTDVSDTYVLPRLKNAQALLGSTAAQAPFSSYTSLLAEVGAVGFAVMLAVYLIGLLRVVGIAMTAMRTVGDRDPLPALAVATTIGFLLLLQMAFLDNWLEVARVTVPTWILLAVVTKEFDVRHQRPE